MPKPGLYQKELLKSLMTWAFSAPSAVFVSFSFLFVFVSLCRRYSGAGLETLSRFLKMSWSLTRGAHLRSAP